MRKEAEFLALLYEASDQLLANNGPLEVITSLCQKVIKHIECDAFLLFLLDEKQGKLYLEVARGALAERGCQQGLIKPGATVCPYSVSEKDPILVGEDQPTSGSRTCYIEILGMHRFACYPLFNADRQIIGRLSFGSHNKAMFMPDDLLLMKGLANVVAVVLQRVRLMKALEQQAMEAQLASVAKSQFLANMSHEIRTPMTAILGFTELLMHADLNDYQRQQFLQIVYRNGQALLLLINDILDLSKIEAGKMNVQREVCSIYQIIEEVESLLRARATEKGLDLTVRYRPPLPLAIETDRLHLRQILINLIGNAIKFTDCGKVQVEVRAVQCHEVSRLQIVVRDTGIGIAPEAMTRLFQPLTQMDASTTRRFGGTGLGLAISKRLAEMLDGDISVESTPGQGSIFTLSVPLTVANLTAIPLATECDALANGPKASPEDSSLRGRVLLSEDSQDSLELFRLFLESLGLSVDCATDGQIARQKALDAFTAGHPYDLLLLDMQMPLVNGYEIARQLRAAGYCNTIIALTAHAMVDDRQKCIDAGCDDYLSKPLDLSTMRNMIAQYLNAPKNMP